MPPRSQAGSSLPVWVVVMTEFGRRLRANHSQGTDHGHGSAMLVLAELLSLDALGLRVRDAVFPGLAPRPYLGLLNGAVG